MDTFATLYAAPDELIAESDDLRHRLVACMYKYVGEIGKYMAAKDMLDEELALIVFEASKKYSWQDCFKNARIQKVLSAPSVIYFFLTLNAGRKAYLANDFRDNINRIFVEESAAYYADDVCVVHPKPDEAHRLIHLRTIKGLSGGDFEAARGHIAKSDECILQDPPDWENSIYQTFKAAENIFKQLTDDSQLNSAKLDKRFKPILDGKMNEATGRDKRAANRAYNGLKEWVQAAHEYRHDAGDAAVVQPSEELALVLISEGYGFVRWMASFK
ncbi:hypothetical protein [Shimia sp.]|uniref:hypothetical protein n=1 Tax=Shimia sp. TaxID=1954381 RepID=UPI003B8E7D1F